MMHGCGNWSVSLSVVIIHPMTALDSQSSAMPASFVWPAATVPAIRVAGRFALNDRDYATTYLGRTHALHLHSYSGFIRIGAQRFALRDGDLTISPAGIPSAYDLQRPGHHWCVHFLPASADGQAHVALPLHLSLHGAATYVRERLKHISRLHARGSAAEPPDALATATAAVALQELLLWCAGRSRIGTRGPAAETIAAVERAAAIIDTRFAEPLSVRSIARQVGASQNSLARRFRQQIGLTMLEYVQMRRIAHARLLLESTDLPIGQIARRVGIEDPQYFNKQIRRQLGDSPSAIRSATRAKRGSR